MIIKVHLRSRVLARTSLLVILLASTTLTMVSPIWAYTNWAIDSSFGTQGSIERNANATAFWGTRDGVGHIVLAQTSGIIEILDENGDADPTFGQGGSVTFSSPGYVQDVFSAFAVDGLNLIASGTSYRSGYSQSEGFLVRYKVSGELDGNFGGNGIVRLHVGVFTDVANVLVAPDKSIFVAGTSYTAGYVATPFIAKFSVNGQLDKSFGSQGILILGGDMIPVVEQNGVSLDRAALDSQGRIVIVGGHRAGIPAFATWFVARITAIGQLDSSFASAGLRYLTPLTGEDYLGRDIALDADNNIYLSGYFCDWSGSSATTYAGFMSFDDSGSLRPAFGNRGILKDLGHPGSVAWRILSNPSGNLVAIGLDHSTNKEFVYEIAQGDKALLPVAIAPLGSKLYFLSLTKTSSNSYLVSANGAVQRITGPPDSTLTATTITSLASGNGSATVTFAAPADNGGSDITDYLVEYKRTASGSWTTFSHAVSASTLSYTITRLSNRTSYDVRVTAVNALGAGIASGTSSVVTNTAVGGPATSIVWGVGPGDQQVSIGTYGRPSSRAGEIIGYEYTLNDGEYWLPVDASSTATVQKVKGLTNGTGYMVKVRAINIAGPGAPSKAIYFRPSGPASAPTNVSATAHSRSVTLTFDAPADNGGTAIIRYGYSINGGAWRSIGLAQSVQIGRLVNGTQYSIRVVAQNAAGHGTISNEVLVTPHS